MLLNCSFSKPWQSQHEHYTLPINIWLESLLWTIKHHTIKHQNGDNKNRTGLFTVDRCEFHNISKNKKNKKNNNYPLFSPVTIFQQIHFSMTFKWYLSKNKWQKHTYKKPLQFEQFPVSTLSTFRFSYHEVTVMANSLINCETYLTSSDLLQHVSAVWKRTRGFKSNIEEILHQLRQTMIAGLLWECQNTQAWSKAFIQPTLVSCFFPLWSVLCRKTSKTVSLC